MTNNRFSENIVMPVCLITVKSNGFVNSMTVAWSTPLSSNPPLFGFAIRKSRFTYDMIMKEKEFSVSFLSYEKAELAVKLGRVSGREGDKVSISGVSLKESEFIKSPYIDEGYFSMECVLESCFEVGDHDFIVGKVINTHKKVNLKDADPIVYLGKDTFSSIDLTKIQPFDTKSIVEAVRQALNRGGKDD